MIKLKNKYTTISIKLLGKDQELTIYEVRKEDLLFYYLSKSDFIVAKSDLSVYTPYGSILAHTNFPAEQVTVNVRKEFTRNE